MAEVVGRHLADQGSWDTAFRSETLVVLHNGTTPAWRVYSLHRAAGVVLGTLFGHSENSGGNGPLPCIGEADSERIRASEGRYLLEGFWGRYVALLELPAGAKTRILRDPSGAVPCFVLRFGDVQVACSHVDDAARLGLLEPRIDWDHVVAYLHFNHMVTSHTGLAGVRQVQAGECVTLASDESPSSEYYWTPGLVYRQRERRDRQSAMCALRSVIQRCVSSWGRSYGSILHQLSGGLDSAIVLACLHRCQPSPYIVCENHYTPAAMGDERAFARLAARNACAELIELPIKPPAEPITRMFEPRLVASPTLVAFVPETATARRHVIEERRIEAVFSGQGGDHFFQGVRTPLIAADYARCTGIRKELLGVMSDTARLTRRSVWSVLGSVIGHGLLRWPYDPYDALRPSPLLSPSARGAIDACCIRHPWIDTASDLPACKRLQVFNIIDTQNFYRIPADRADIVHPLIAQPVIELCLQIPSYDLSYGGIDRALVREAFAGLVAPEILSRTQKGATTGYFSALLIRSLVTVREFLLNGLLIVEGVLDRRQTESALQEPSLLRRPEQIPSVLDAITAEFWVRGWTSQAR